MERHLCSSRRCGRPFAVLYRRDWQDIPLPVAVACPHCGRWDMVCVPTGGIREADGTYVLPLDYRIAALEA